LIDPGLCADLLEKIFRHRTRDESMKSLILIIALVLASPAGRCDWTVKGEGNFSCPDYVEAKRTNGAKLYSSATWVQGFISGANYQRALQEDTSSFIGQELPAASIVQWLETYCRANPQDYLSDAATALVVELKKQD
jgi:hypothetical protein